MSEEVGPALVADVVRAAIAWRAELGQLLDTGELTQAVDALSAALTLPAETWVPATWEQVKAGDHVRLPAGDGYAEADVESASELNWVASGKHEVRIRLAGRDQLYTMPASGPVEVRKYFPPDFPPAWAAEAFRILSDTFGQVTPIEQEEP